MKTIVDLQLSPYRDSIISYPSAKNQYCDLQTATKTSTAPPPTSTAAELQAMTSNVPSLIPLPPPGLVIFPGFTALRQESFHLKESYKHFTRSHTKVSFLAPNGKPGAPFLVIDEPKQEKGKLREKTVSFQTVDGNVEVMSIAKNEGGKGSVYRGLDAAGMERWRFEVKRHSFSGKSTEYTLTIFPTPTQSLSLPIEKKVLGQDKGILFNGTPVATMSQNEAYDHLRREDIVHVAPGMDILVALGASWARYDKGKEDEKEAIDALGSVAG